jgi:polyhydroxybutyrate depolymerase
MRQSFFVAPLMSLLIAANACGAVPPGSTRFTLTHDGLTRSYIVHRPAGASSRRPPPVILNLHGAGSNGAGQERYSGMDQVADREHFLVVYPDGTGRGMGLTWNAGACCAYAMFHRVDDVGFIRAVIDDLARRTPIDRHRIYATGISNGGMMSYRLAAEAPDLVAAIAPVAGTMVLPQAHPTHPIPIIHFHSIDDSFAKYDGGYGRLGAGGRTMGNPPVETELALWSGVNGCRGTPVVADRRAGAPGSADDGNTATKLTYGPCSSGAAIVLWKLSGSGHVWPGAQSAGARFLGRSTHLVDANEEMWAFFRKGDR